MVAPIRFIALNRGACIHFTWSIAVDSLGQYFSFLHVLDVSAKPIFHNMPSQWFAALVLSGGSYFFLLVLRNVVVRRFGKYAESTPNQVDDFVVELLRKTGSWFLAAIALYLGSFALTLHAGFHLLDRSLFVITFIQVGIWATMILNSILLHSLKSNPQDSSKNTAIIAFRFLGRVVIWSIILLLILDNVGIKVISLMAGLGVGGIAVALAVQNILGDLLSSVSIVLDKPFEIGDFIVIGDCMGTVEQVGLKTTRIRSLSGEQLIISNSDMLSSRIHNYKRMYERRMVFSLGVTYQTPRKQLSEIPVLLKEIIEKIPKTRFERAHLKAYGDSAIEYEYVYWVLDPDFGLSMDIQQQLNFDLYDAFIDRGVEFAYPTQTIHLVSPKLPVAP